MIQPILGLNYFRKGMHRIFSTLQSKTSRVVFLHILVPSYNSTCTYLQVLTTEPSSNLTLITELWLISKSHLLQVAKDKMLYIASLSIRSAYKWPYILVYNLKGSDDITTNTSWVETKTLVFLHSSCPTISLKPMIEEEIE